MTRLVRRRYLVTGRLRRHHPAPPTPGGFQRRHAGTVENEDLWRRLDEAAQRHEVEWIWVKARVGDPGTERADALANRGVAEATARAQAP
jgi:ribonuclease HI